MLKFIFFFFLLISNFSTFLTQDTLEALYVNKEYTEIIDLLTTKSKTTPLSPQEYNKLILSYTKLKQHSNSLIYSNKMIEYCESKFDTANLVIAINRKAEALIDLFKIEEGVAFSEEKSKLFRPKDSLDFQQFCFKWGMLYYNNGQYQKAFDVYQKITAEKYRNTTLFNHNFAVTNMGLESYDTALIYYKKTIAASLLNNDTYSGTAAI